MYKLNRLIKLLKNKRGEMLLESVLSLFILTLVVTAAGAMIATATAINKSSNQHSKEYYEEYGTVLRKEAIPSTEKTEMDIKIIYDIEGKINGSDENKLPSSSTTLSNHLTVTNKGIISID